MNMVARHNSALVCSECGKNWPTQSVRTHLPSRTEGAQVLQQSCVQHHSVVRK